MNAECARKMYKREIGFLEKIGIRSFRDLLFKLEREIHTGKKLKNYHISGSENFESYCSYILYHCVLHIISIILSAAAIVLRNVFVADTLVFLDLLMAAAILMNIFCLLLQRYNYLRIKLLAEHDEARRRYRIDTYAQTHRELAGEFSAQQLKEALLLCRKISSAYEEGKELILTEHDAAALSVLERLSSGLFATHTKGAGTAARENEECTERIENSSKLQSTVSKLELLVDKLAVFFKLPAKKRALSSMVVLCDDPHMSRRFSNFSSGSSKRCLLDRLAAAERIINMACMG